MILLIVLIAVDEYHNRTKENSIVVLEPWTFYITPNIVDYVQKILTLISSISVCNM